MTDISIIIPFLNEEDNIDFLSDQLRKFVLSKQHLTFEILLVNDGSTDFSVKKIAESVFPENTKLISLSQNYGSHAALRSGVLHAKGTYITFIYADLQDPLENIIEMVEKANAGNDIVWGYRKQTQNTWIEKQFSSLYSGLMRKYINPKYPKNGFDVVLFNRKVLNVLNNNIESHSSIFLQVLNMGFQQDYVEYEKISRKFGKSKWTLSKKVKLLLDSFVAFSYTPIRLVSYVGISFFIIGICWTIYIIGRKLIYDDLQDGWPALVAILMVGFGITNISLGIIAEYLWRTLDASVKRPVFIISEIIDVGKK